MKNIGSTEKIVRLVLFVGLAVAGLAAPGNTRYVLWAVSLVPLVTALFNFCPLWALLKINTAHPKA